MSSTRMRWFRLFWLVLLLLMGHGDASYSQSSPTPSWQPIGPFGGYFSSLTMDRSNPDVLYAGMRRTHADDSTGIYKSTNGGQNWALHALDGYSVYVVAVHPNDSALLLAVAEFPNFSMNFAVHRSVDGGSSWTKVADDAGLYGFEFDPTNASIIYNWGSEPSRVFKSTDAGQSWFPIQSGLLADSWPYELKIDPNNPSVLYLTTLSYQMFKSTNGGSSWVLLAAGTGLMGFDIIPGTSHLIADNGFGEIWKSTDGGSTWAYWSFVGTVGLNSLWTIHVDTSNPNVIYGMEDGVWKSIDGGLTWARSTDQGLPYQSATAASVRSLIIHPQNPSILYGHFMAGIFKSEDAAVTWSRIGNGEVSRLGANVNDIAIPATQPEMIYAGVYGGVYKSINSGTTWTIMNGGLSGGYIPALAVHPIDANIVLAGAWPSNDDSGRLVFKTTNGGVTWTPSDIGIPVSENGPVTEIVFHPTDPSVIYLGGYGGRIFKSVDGGTSWSLLTDLSSGSLYIKAIVVVPANPAIIYAAATDVLYGAGITGVPNPENGVWKSVDGGQTWAKSETGIPGDKHVMALVIDPTDSSTLYAAVWAGVSEWDGGIYKTTDAGATWLPVNTGLVYLQMTTLAIDPANPNILYAASDSALLSPGPTRVYRTMNAGTSWELINDGIRDTQLSKKLVLKPGASNVLYLGTRSSGIWMNTSANSTPVSPGGGGGGGGGGGCGMVGLEAVLLLFLIGTIRWVRGKTAR